MKRILIAAMMLIGLGANAQTLNGDRVVARQGLYLKDWWLNGIVRDTSEPASHSLIPTWKVVRDWVEGRTPTVSPTPSLQEVVNVGNATNWDLQIGGAWLGTGYQSQNLRFGADAMTESGYSAMNNNLAIGNKALQLSRNGRNVAIGNNSVWFGQNASDIVAVGYNSLQTSYNLTKTVGIGSAVAPALYQGDGNFFGGYNAAGGLRNSWNNTIVGSSAGSGLNNMNFNYYNNTILGANVTGTSAMNNTVLIGDGGGNVKVKWDSVGVGTVYKRFDGSANFAQNYNNNSFVQKRYVDSTVLVPRSWDYTGNAANGFYLKNSGSPQTSSKYGIYAGNFTENGLNNCIEIGVEDTINETSQKMKLSFYTEDATYMSLNTSSGESLLFATNQGNSSDYIKLGNTGSVTLVQGSNIALSGSTQFVNGSTSFNGSLTAFYGQTTLNASAKLNIGTGVNAIIGSATLSAGQATINTNKVTAGSLIFVSVNQPGGTQGFLSTQSIVPGSSFKISSTSTSETSVVNWWIIN